MTPGLPALADCPPESWNRRYHPRPLCRIGDPGVADSLWYANLPAGGLGVLSRNDAGEVAGTYMAVVSTQEVPRPFVWLPVANYGLAAGFHDLLTLAGASETLIGYAWDISDDGLVVGGVGGRPDTSAANCRAAAWPLSSWGTSGPLDQIALDPTSPGSPFLWSIAIAIEPEADPSEPIDIVGTGGKVCWQFRHPARFPATGAGAVEIFHELPPTATGDPTADSLRKWACSVTNGFTDPVGSYDSPSVTPVEEWVTCPSSITFEPFACASVGVAGALYTPLSTEFFRREIVTDPNDFKRQWTGVRSISRDGQFVAGYVKPSGGSGCPPKPAIWPYGQMAPAEVLPMQIGGDSAVAQRWREFTGQCGDPIVVGWQPDSTDPIGALWDACPNGGWCHWFVGPDLAVGATSDYRIEQVYAVLDSGEILALVSDVAQFSSVQGTYAAILGLAGDFDRDWRIGASDLSMLLGAWNATDQMEVDLSGDGIVGAADFSMLLGLWTGTARQPLETPCAGEFCLPELESSSSLEGGGLNGTPSLDASVQLLGFQSLESMVIASQGWSLADFEEIGGLLAAAVQAAGGDQ